MHKDSFDFVDNADGDYYDLESCRQENTESRRRAKGIASWRTAEDFPTWRAPLSRIGLRVSREAHSDRYLSIILL